MLDSQDMDKSLASLTLRLGDDCLILGQRVSEWCGHGPALEEDIALANVALDLIGQARMWLDLAGELEGRGRTSDDLAYLRHSHEFRNVLLVEQPNGDFAHTIVRQMFFDTWHFYLLQALSTSPDSRLADIAEKAVKEAAYHLNRSADLCVRLGDGTEESHRRMQSAVNDLWCYTSELFQSDMQQDQLVSAQLLPDAALLKTIWIERVSRVLEEATLAIPDQSTALSGGRNGVHSEHHGYILAEMQFLRRSYPGATW